MAKILDPVILRSWAVIKHRSGGDWPAKGHARLIVDGRGFTITADTAREIAAELLAAAEAAEKD